MRALKTLLSSAILAVSLSACGGGAGSFVQALPNTPQAKPTPLADIPLPVNFSGATWRNPQTMIINASVVPVSETDTCTGIVAASVVQTVGNPGFVNLTIIPNGTLGSGAWACMITLWGPNGLRVGLVAVTVSGAAATP